MRAVILETSTEKSCIILAENGAIRKKKFLSGGSELSKNLAQEVALLLQESPDKVDFVAVGQGPGSYTGIRVGAALAKGLSYGWKVPLYGFCSLQAFAPATEGPFAVLTDARMGGFYLLLGEKTADVFSFQPPKLVKAEEILSFLKEVPHLTSPHPSLIQKRLPQLVVEEKNPDLHLLAKWAFSTDFLTPLTLTYLSSP